MTATRIDFAVLGASPLARLLAGLLKTVHGKSVLYVGESQSGYRLPRSIDLSFAPITRPETWTMLEALVPETAKLISRIGGRSGLSKVDAVFFAETPAGLDAVGHVRHMAQAFKLAAERAPPSLLGLDRKGLLLRDAIMLHRASLEPALDGWLEKSGVQRAGADTHIALRPDGSAEIGTDGQRFEIGQAILVDDAAIIAHLPENLWPPNLRAQVASTILTEPAKPMSAGLTYQLDTGIMLTQHARGGIAALGPGPIEQFGAAVRKLLGAERDVRQVGQSSYRRMITLDGAPAVGRVGGIGVDVVTGFGPTGAFFAPGLARWLSGNATLAENNWFGARLVDRDPAGSIVADIGDVR